MQFLSYKKELQCNSFLYVGITKQLVFFYVRITLQLVILYVGNTVQLVFLYVGISVRFVSNKKELQCN